MTAYYSGTIMGTGPTFSEDGLWWWSGERWVPSVEPFQAIPADYAPPAPAPRRGPFASGMLGCLGVGAAVAGVFLLAILAMGACGVGLTMLGAGAPTP